jgi:hypothetical protein
MLNKIVLLKEKNSIKRHYRFSDVINHSGNYWKESNDFILKQDHFIGSILRSYIERCPDNNKTINPDKIKLLYTIIRSKKAKIPKVDELVIHLRTGDVIQFDWFLKKDYVSIIQDYVDKHNIKRVTFCTAFHYGNNTTQNMFLYTDEKHRRNKMKLDELFKNVVDRFKYIQFDVKSSTNIDEDFMYMCLSRHFVKDKGGFSDLVEVINKYHLHKVIGQII